MTNEQKKRISELRASGESYGKIAAALGISQNTVKSYCRRNDIAETVTEQTAISGVSRCECCGKVIQQIEGHKTKRFCCDKCRNRWWNSHLDLVKRKAVYKFKCIGCGREFTVYGNANRKYCSHECYIEDRFGGRRRG